MENHRRITSSVFPVDEMLLPHLNLSYLQHEELRRYAIQAAMDAVRDGPTWGHTNIECAVSNGWKVISARPTACFMTKRQTKTKQKWTSNKQLHEGREEDDKRIPPSTPCITIPRISGLDSVRTPFTVQSFAPIGFEGAKGQHFMAHAVLPHSLEDVMSTLYCEHTREMRALTWKAHGETALDCCVLQTLEGATLEDPFWYLGIKWLVLRSPMQPLMTSREFVYLEHLGTHIDPETGRRMLYRIIQSIDIRPYGGQESYYGLRRGHIEAAFVFWMDDENEVQSPLLHMCAKGRIHMKGNMADGFIYRFFKSFWRSEGSLLGPSSGITIDDGTRLEEQPIESSKRKKETKKKLKIGVFQWVQHLKWHKNG